jgi:hypothetical protein
MAIEIMPRVAIQPVRSQTGGVEGRVVPMQDQTGATLRAVGEGAQDLGRAVTAAADTFQDQEDVAQSLRMRNLYDADVETIMNDPETGFLSTVGMDANKDRRKQSFDQLKAAREKVMKLAQNDVQRLNFSEHADRSDQESNGRANLHQEREVRNFRAGETKVAADLGIQRAIQLVGTDEGDIAAAGAMRDMEALADLYGWPKGSAQRAKLMQGATDALHAGVIDQYAQDPMTAPQARAYLDANRGAMSLQASTYAANKVRTATIGSEAAMAAGVAMSAAIDAKSTEMAKQGRSAPTEFDTLAMFDDAEAKIGAQSLPQEVKDAALDRLRGERQQMLRQNAQRSVSALNDAATWLAADDGRSLAKMMTERPDLAAAIQGDDMAKLRKFDADSRRMQTAPAAYAEAWALTDDELRGKSAEQLVHRFWGALDDGDMNSLMARHRVANGKGSDKDRKILSEEDRVQEAFFRASGIARGSLDDVGKQRLYLFKERVQKRLDGRGDLTDQQFQEVLDNAVLDKGFISEWFGDSATNFTTILPDEQAEAYVQSGGENIFATQAGRTDRASVPSVGAEIGDRIVPSEREKIVFALQRAGRPVTEQAIADAWMAQRARVQQQTGIVKPIVPPMNPMTSMDEFARRQQGLGAGK